MFSNNKSIYLAVKIHLMVAVFSLKDYFQRLNLVLMGSYYFEFFIQLE